MHFISALTPILKDLIAFKSISNTSNVGLIDYLEQNFKGLGFETARIFDNKTKGQQNLLCSIGPKKAQGLMLCGHTDVVPTKGQNWLSDPFSLKEEEDRYIGRGVADMKSFIAATIIALKHLDLAKLQRPLSLLWTYDEETGGHGSLLAAKELKNYLEFLPESAIIGEPTDFYILRKHAGHVTLKLQVTGKGAHSSNPSLGISAIKVLVAILKDIMLLEEELEKEIIDDPHFERPFVTLNIGKIEGGNAVNVVPEHAQALLGFRPLPGSSIKDILERIRAIVKHHGENHRAHVELNVEHIMPAMATRSNTKLENILRPLSKESKQKAAQFGTDGANLNAIGIECLIFGPGSIDVAHKANEWILKSDVDESVKKIMQVIKNYLF